MSRRTAILAMQCLVALVCVGSLVATNAEEPRVEDPTRPFVPAGTASGPASDAPAGLKLTAVRVSPTRRIAVIDGRFYTEGERVNGELITAIEPGAIRVRRGDTDVLIRIHRDGVVTTRTDGVPGQ